jgi:hypothetical protein
MTELVHKSLPDPLAHRMFQMTERIGTYLERSLGEDGNFPSRSHYGEAFACDLWHRLGGSFTRQIPKVLDAIGKWDEMKVELNRPDESQWEFILYGLLPSFADDPVVKGEFFNSWVESNPRVTNYRLLRALATMRAGRSSRSRAAIYGGWPTVRPPGSRYSLALPATGFIQDRIGSYSSQYHAFSAALLFDLARETSFPFLMRRFRRATDVIVDLCLSNGDFNYVGRGQEQLFGYGSAIYALAAAYSVSGETGYLDALQSILGRLEKFQRPDGSLPLVLNELEQGHDPAVSNTDTSVQYGWYSYNNLFDYLPFAGSMIRRAAEILDHAQQRQERKPLRSKLPNEQFITHRGSSYEAVISRPHGEHTNNLAQPLICFRGVTVTPCFGGDDALPEIYGVDSLPLPYLVLANSERWNFADNLNYELKPGLLIGGAPGATHRRYFRFEESVIYIRDEITVDTVDTSWRDASVVLNFMFFSAQENDSDESQNKSFLLESPGLDHPWGALHVDSPASVSDGAGAGPMGPVDIVAIKLPIVDGHAESLTEIRFNMDVTKDTASVATPS